jgi:translation initiation factor 1
LDFFISLSLLSMSKKIPLFKGGLAYSTNSALALDGTEHETKGTLEPQEQKLKVILDTKQRAGKKVTLVQNFIGTEDDLETLCKLLKTKCGCGGSAKDSVIIIQGDVRTKVLDLLIGLGYKAK